MAHQHILGCLVPYSGENVINMWRYNQKDENEDDMSSAEEEKEEDMWASFCTNARRVWTEWKTSLSKKKWLFVLQSVLWNHLRFKMHRKTQICSKVVNDLMVIKQLVDNLLEKLQWTDRWHFIWLVNAVISCTVYKPIQYCVSLAERYGRVYKCRYIFLRSSEWVIS